MHVVTVQGKGIETMADLKGNARVHRRARQRHRSHGLRLLEAAGLDKDKHVKRERLSVAESVNALKDNEDRRLLLGRRPAHRRGLRTWPIPPAPR